MQQETFKEFVATFVLFGLPFIALVLEFLK
uniref:Holin-like toxin n=1 Tax=Dulem virus 31 TaxID=3145749 RepID=A0AAU8AUS2_9VIRU